MWNWKQTVISDSEASPSAGVSLSVWSPQIVLRSYPDIQYSSCSLNPYLIDNSYIIRSSQKAAAAAAPACFADTERKPYRRRQGGDGALPQTATSPQWQMTVWSLIRFYYTKNIEIQQTFPKQNGMQSPIFQIIVSFDLDAYCNPSVHELSHKHLASYCEKKSKMLISNNQHKYMCREKRMTNRYLKFL